MQSDSLLTDCFRAVNATFGCGDNTNDQIGVQTSGANFTAFQPLVNLPVGEYNVKPLPFSTISYDCKICCNLLRTCSGVVAV